MLDGTIQYIITNRGSVEDIQHRFMVYGKAQSDTVMQLSIYLIKVNYRDKLTVLCAMALSRGETRCIIAQLYFLLWLANLLVQKNTINVVCYIQTKLLVITIILHSGVVSGVILSIILRFVQKYIWQNNFHRRHNFLLGDVIKILLLAINITFEISNRIYYSIPCRSENIYFKKFYF